MALLCCNSGHFNVEINIPDLESLTKAKRTMRAKHGRIHIQKMVDHLYLLAERPTSQPGRSRRSPIRGYGYVLCKPSIMCRVRCQNSKSCKPKCTLYPKDIDEKVAELKLKSMNVNIDELTAEQKKYLSTWEMGTT